jgi:hypothetical protein
MISFIWKDKFSARAKADFVIKSKKVYSLLIADMFSNSCGIEHHSNNAGILEAKKNIWWDTSDRESEWWVCTGWRQNALRDKIQAASPPASLDTCSIVFEFGGVTSARWPISGPGRQTDRHSHSQNHHVTRHRRTHLLQIHGLSIALLCGKFPFHLSVPRAYCILSHRSSHRERD